MHALTGARIVRAPGDTLESGTIVVRDGLIEAVGRDRQPPADARVWNLTGFTIYPGLIELYFPLEADDEATGETGESDHTASPDKLLTNPHVTPAFRVADALPLSADQLKPLHETGFTTALIVPSSGVVRGASALVALREGPAAEQTLSADVAHHFALERRGWQSAEYPTSRMGAVALVRQALLDAEYALAAAEDYARSRTRTERPPNRPDLAGLGEHVRRRAPLVFEAETAQIAMQLARELSSFELTPWIALAGSDAYKWPDALVKLENPLVMTLNLPPPPRWDSAAERQTVDLSELVHWDMAPSSANALYVRGKVFALSAHGLPSRDQFSARVRRVIERGLPPEEVLRSLTEVPAGLLGMTDALGHIGPGAMANFTVTDGGLFGEATNIVEVWVDGVRHDVTAPALKADAVAGRWTVTAGEAPLTLDTTVEASTLTGVGWTGLEGGAEDDAVPLEAVALHLGRLRATVPSQLTRGEPMHLTLQARGRRAVGQWRRGAVRGQVQGEFGQPEAKADSAVTDTTATRADTTIAGLEAPISAEFPRWPPDAPPAPPAVLVQRATLWTMAGDTVEADLLAVDGKVRAIGSSLKAPPGAAVIDAAGKHVTPGLIDSHSHSFLSTSSNECSSICTAEVRIADELDAESPNLYAQLAGGVTAANLLHGSCNAIGGQNAVLKLRRGSPAPDLVFAKAPPGVKFALGENPKRSNWQADQTRFPATRPGVEQAIRERFLRAREYAADRDQKPARRDLQLEALTQVLTGERYVHCHAYRQDEMLMLMNLAHEFGFTVRSFQHGLEAYKIAPEIARAGTGVSIFIDWWSGKHEMYDGIPYNAAILWRNGVVTALHSDNSAIARRLNLEAAKAVRYGGVPAAAALAMVTLNPAKQLGIDRWIGSLEVGKDADFVVWSGDPLSTSTVCEQTWIEGRSYFDRERDLGARGTMEAYREALLTAAERAWPDEPAAGWKPTFERTSHAEGAGAGTLGDCLDGAANP